MSDIFIGMNIDIRDITYSYTIYRLYIFMYIDFLPILWKYYRYTRWWFQIFLIFIPILGKDSHFWLMFFSKGLVQPPTSIPSRELTYPPKAAYLKMIFLFPNWDTLVPLEGNVTCNCAFPSLKKPSSHSHQTLESTMISFNGVISAATRGRQWQVPMCWEKTGSGEGEKQIQNQNGDIYIYDYIYAYFYIFIVWKILLLSFQTLVKIDVWVQFPASSSREVSRSCLAFFQNRHMFEVVISPYFTQELSWNYQHDCPKKGETVLVIQHVLDNSFVPIRWNTKPIFLPLPLSFDIYICMYIYI